MFFFPLISPLNVVPSKVHIFMIEQFQRNDHWMDVGNLPDLFSFFIFFFLFSPAQIKSATAIMLHSIGDFHRETCARLSRQSIVELTTHAPCMV